MALVADDRTLLAFRRNLVVAASAGTGKTHRLTGLYVMLALGLTSMGERDVHTPAPACPPDRILATTFSRAAAREIARRVERALVAIASTTPAPHPFEAEIAARLDELEGRVDAHDVMARARAALTSFADARIDTLHGVARRLIVRNASALGQPLGAPMLDEDDAEQIGAAAVDAALSAALEAGGDRARSARALSAAAGSVFFARRRVIALLDRLDEEGVEPRELALEDHAKDARELLEQLRRIAEAVARSGCEKGRAPAAKLAAALGARDAFSPSAGLALVEVLAIKIPTGIKRTAADALLDEFRSGLAGDSNADRAARLGAFLTEAPRLAERERGIVAILCDARARLAEAKRKAGGLGFGDLLRLARDAMLSRDDIASAARAEVDALLVDEFQDTSRVQRDLVFLLRERRGVGRASHAAPSSADIEPHGLFLVGDRKQSIYGFRGADVAVFAETCAELGGPAAERALALAASSKARPPTADFVALAESRRSGGVVLAFVNAFAALDFQPEGSTPRSFEIVYGPGEQLTPMASREDEGEVVIVRDDGRSPEGTEPIVASASGVAREAHLAAAAVAIEIARSGRAPRDVAVLARRRATIPFVELALARLDVPYVVAGRALYDAPEVRDASALLALILDPRDRLALATVLRGPMVALSDPSLAALAVPAKGLSIALSGSRQRAPAFPLPSDERARLDAFRARYRDLRAALLALSPGEALREAIRRFELERVLAALPRAEARIANLDRLVTIARRRGGTLAGFSRWLRARIADETDEPEAAIFSNEDDAVRLTTIHGSKGLDFPVVVLVDLHAPPRPEPTTLGFFGAGASGSQRGPSFVVRHFSEAEGGRAGVIATRALGLAQSEARARESAERRRLTYVAVTRPRDKLVLVGAADLASRRSGSAWQAVTSALESGALDGLARVEQAFDLLGAAAALPPRSKAALPAEPELRARAKESPARSLAISTSALAVFSGCARRFRLRHLLGFEEPVTQGDVDLDLDLALEQDDDRRPALTNDPRAVGRAAHRLLERWPIEDFGRTTAAREVARRLRVAGLGAASADITRVAGAIAAFLSSAYAASLRERRAVVVREAPFALEVATPGAPDAPARALVLRGAIDLVARFEDGDVDVVDYKLARATLDLGAHAFQLRAYALAASRAQPYARVAACVVPLLGDGQPRWLGEGVTTRTERAPIDEAARSRFAEELARNAQAFAAARHEDRFEGLARRACEQLGCGFIAACHGATAPEGPAAQLGLFG